MLDAFSLGDQEEYLDFLNKKFDEFMRKNYPNQDITVSKFPLKLVKKALMQEKRFGLITEMNKRSDVFLHEKRIVKLVEFSSPYILNCIPTFNLDYARFYSYSHDDVESFSRLGDVATIVKNELTEKERILLCDEEEIIARFLGDRIELSKFNYKEILLDSLKKITLEAKISSCLDKIDGFMESLLEVLMGNSRFVPVLENYGKEVWDTFAKYEETSTLLENYTSTNRNSAFFNFDGYLKVSSNAENLLKNGREIKNKTNYFREDFPAFLYWHKLFKEKNKSKRAMEFDF